MVGRVEHRVSHRGTTIEQRWEYSMSKNVNVQEIPAAGEHGPVRFTKRQYEYLEKLYGENPGGPETTNEELRFRAGQRSVILRIKSLVQA